VKVLIAYDGSESAHTAIDGLRRTGLPSEADALVVSVAEVWLPMPEHEASLKDTFPTEIPGAQKDLNWFQRMIITPDRTALRGHEDIEL
jgi:hypothetical protein